MTTPTAIARLLQFACQFARGMDAHTGEHSIPADHVVELFAEELADEGLTLAMIGLSTEQSCEVVSQVEGIERFGGAQ